MVEGRIRYVCVAWADRDFLSWYKDEDALSNVGDWVKADRSYETDMIGEVKEVRHCLPEEPPCRGRIKSINSLYKTYAEIKSGK